MTSEVLPFPVTVLAFVAVVDAVQEAEIRGATIALLPKTVAVHTVTTENRRQSHCWPGPSGPPAVPAPGVSSLRAFESKRWSHRRHPERPVSVFRRITA